MKFRIRNTVDSERGISYFAVLITLILVVAGWILGSQMFRFVLCYQEIYGDMEILASQANKFSDGYIRSLLLKEIKKLEIPIEDEDALIIQRDNGEIRIELYWEEVLYVDFSDLFGEDYTYDLHVFEMNPLVERPI